jgi:hypothetical protein
MADRPTDHAVDELLVALEAAVLGHPVDSHRPNGDAQADPVAVVDRPVPLDDAVTLPGWQQAIERAVTLVPGE